MKRFWILLLLVAGVFLPIQTVNAQMLVADEILTGIMTKTGIDQYIYYAQSIMDQASQIEHLYNQVTYTIKSYEMAFKNLSTIGDIKSYDDFMNWYNRQLYLERRAMETFDSMNVKVGKKSYALTDIAGIAKGLDETYVGFWDKEFNEEQRKEMWLNLGLTPANYAYRQVWKEKELALAQKFVALSEIQNEEYMKQMESGKQKKARMEADKSEKNMGEKEIMALQLDTLIDMNKTLNDTAMMQALALEKQGIDIYNKKTPNVAPLISDWADDAFGTPEK